MIFSKLEARFEYMNSNSYFQCLPYVRDRTQSKVFVIPKIALPNRYYQFTDEKIESQRN